MSNKVVIVPDTGVLAADVDVTAAGTSLITLGKDVEILKEAISELSQYGNISTSEQIKLKDLLSTIQLDPNKLILAGPSLAPQSITGNNLGISSVSANSTQQGSVTTVAVLQNAITQTSIQEVTTPQAVTTTTVTFNTTTPPAQSTWTLTPVNTVTLTPFGINDDILLTAYIESSVTDFYITASQNALSPSSGTSTQVYDQMFIQFIETNTNTLIKQFNINIFLSTLIQNGTSEFGTYATSIDSTGFSYTISHLFSGFSEVNIVTYIGALDMVSQYNGHIGGGTVTPMTVTITDAFVSLTDFQR